MDRENRLEIQKVHGLGGVSRWPLVDVTVELKVERPQVRNGVVELFGKLLGRFYIGNRLGGLRHGPRGKEQQQQKKDRGKNIMPHGFPFTAGVTGGAAARSMLEAVPNRVAPHRLTRQMLQGVEHRGS